MCKGKATAVRSSAKELHAKIEQLKMENDFLSVAICSFAPNFMGISGTSFQRNSISPTTKHFNKINSN